MRLPRRPVDQALAAGAPSTPTSNRVHPGDLPPLQGMTPRRLPPLSTTPSKYLEPEPEQVKFPFGRVHDDQLVTAHGHHAGALSPGEAAEIKRKRQVAGVAEDLLYAFELFDRDKSGMIDAGELMDTMILLAKAGRMQEPSDAQVAEMFDEADTDGDGEIDFEEFVRLIEHCDLHPRLCSRCQQSQFIMHEDMWFGEPRPRLGEDETTRGWRARSNCRIRMAVREEKKIHFSFAIVGSFAPFQAAFLCIGSFLWFANSDRRDHTAITLICGCTAIVMCAFGITIGAASRPALPGNFILYGLWQVATFVIVVMLLQFSSEAATTCELSLGAGLADITTDDACPELIARELITAGIDAGQLSVQAAKVLCEDGIGAGLCVWSDMVRSGPYFEHKIHHFEYKNHHFDTNSSFL